MYFLYLICRSAHELVICALARCSVVVTYNHLTTLLLLETCEHTSMKTPVQVPMVGTPLIDVGRPWAPLDIMEHP